MTFENFVQNCYKPVPFWRY